MAVLWPIALSLVVAAIVALTLKHTHRRQMAALLERLAELEAARGEVKLNVVNSPGAGPPAGGGTGAAPEEGDPTAAPADVLAGRTTYVQRLVEGAEGGVVSLADQAILCVHAGIGDSSVTPAVLADQLNVSLRTLERGLALSLQCSPRQLIVAMKMREARRLLSGGRYNVSEVAARLGFSSPAHFSRRFRAFYRVAPSVLVARASRKVA